MLFGSDGVVGIYFDNYELTRELCSFGLVFIMFYGGFGTNWKEAKPVARESILMSTFGVIITSGLTGLFCYFVLKTSLLEGMLIGSIVGSTDAASVFSILRSQKLNLKGEIASILEVESGSNDPIAYMLTLIVLTLMNNGGISSIVPTVIAQIIFGILVGVILSKITIYIMRNANFEVDGFYTIFITAIAILSYALSEWIGGNGYLSVYIAGIIIGNSKIPHKRSLVHFFDGVSWIMQIMLFFVLGLLAFPSELPSVIGSSILISIFMIIIARPIATFSVLSWFKIPFKQQLFVSWVGLRGAASIVFAIYAITSGIPLENDIFHIIFFIAFTDYQEDRSTTLIEYNVDSNNNWIEKSIMEADIPEEILIVMIKRDNEIIVPKGSTLIKKGDVLVLSGNNIEYILEKNIGS